jgi:hypothetical protein
LSTAPYKSLAILYRKDAGRCTIDFAVHGYGYPAVEQREQRQCHREQSRRPHKSTLNLAGERGLSATLSRFQRRRRQPRGAARDADTGGVAW